MNKETLPGLYSIISADLSHNQLLLRYVGPHGNTDLLFQRVTRINIPFRIELSSLRMKRLPKGDMRVYFSDEKDDHFIDCDRVMGQNNSVGLVKSTIPIHIEKPLTDEQLFAMVKNPDIEFEWEGEPWEVVLE